MSFQTIGEESVIFVYLKEESVIYSNIILFGHKFPFKTHDFFTSDQNSNISKSPSLIC